MTINLEYPQFACYKFISGGAAYNLTLDFYPDFVEAYNYTQSGTVAKIVKSTWFRGFPAGDCISIKSVADNGVTADLNSVLETTNGYTWAGAAAAFTDQHRVISGATQASPCVLTTSAVHGLTDGDRVTVTDVIGMLQLNSRQFVVDVLSTTTIGLYDIHGDAIDSSGYTAYVSGGKLNMSYEATATVNVAESFILTLGTGVVGSNSDVIYVAAYKAPGGVVDLGDIG